MLEKVYTAAVGPNIAFVKYWGQRRGTGRNLPGNSSLSMTLEGTRKPLLTATSIMFSKKFASDTFYIDGRSERNPKGAGKNVLGRLRKMAGTNAKALVVSYNSFPKSSGMASSASGIAALTFVAAKALGLRLSHKQLSLVAREGGSACRNVIGGIAMWRRGKRKDGGDSYSVQVVKPSYWPDLADVICVVSTSKKKVSSSEGHLRTPATSALYASRSRFAERNVRSAISAIKRKDFQTLAEVIMRDSNSMHSIMLDSWPPMRYLTDASWEVVEKAQSLNDRAGRYIAAYSLDAGANVHIITTKRYVLRVFRSLKGLRIKRIIGSRMGEGPHMLCKEAALIDSESHRPIFLKDTQSFFEKITQSQ